MPKDPRNARHVPATERAGSHHRLFVYGTLKRGGPMGHLLESGRFLGEFVVPGSLYDLGRFPALVLEGQAPVSGQLWECTVETLRRLDSYEGVEEGLFRRVAIRIEDGPAWVYVAGPAILPGLRAEQRIATGVWPPPRRGAP